MPIPRAASTRCAGTARMPSYVLRMIGSSVAIHNPTIAGSAPMPSRLIISASLPSVGIDVTMFTAWIAPSAQRAIQGRDSQMPMAMPRTIAAEPETATSTTCCFVR